MVENCFSNNIDQIKESKNQGFSDESFQTFNYRPIKEVGRPIIHFFNDKINFCKIVEKDSYFIFDHSFEIVNEKYKHIILTQDLSKYKNNAVKILKNLKLIVLDDFVKENLAFKQCLSNIFNNNLLDNCDTTNFKNIKEAVINGNYDGIIDSQENLLIYSEHNLQIENVQLSYF